MLRNMRCQVKRDGFLVLYNGYEELLPRITNLFGNLISARCEVIKLSAKPLIEEYMRKVFAMAIFMKWVSKNEAI
jgi:hypothetical protein